MDMSAHVTRSRIVDFEYMLNGYIKWIPHKISYFARFSLSESPFLFRLLAHSSQYVFFVCLLIK